MRKIKLYSRKIIFFTIIILVIILSTVSYTLSTLADANQKVKQDITDFARGTYDLLIRPSDARTEIEKQLNLVEENYLGVGDGGITIDQWQEVKHHPQVEIAAPVASIGLFTARERTFMLSRNVQDAMYYEFQYRTNDGVNTYPAQPNYIYDFGNKIEDAALFSSSIEIGNYYTGFDIAAFMFPTSYHQVVAISPEEEGKLTGYDFSPLTEKVSDYDAYKDGQFSTPIMSLADVSVPVSVQLTVDPLADVSKEELAQWKSEFSNGNPARTLTEDPALYNQVIETVISKKRMNQEQVFEFVPQEGHSPFKENLLYVNEENQLSLAEDSFQEGVGGAVKTYGQRFGYKLEPVVYEIEDEQTLKVKQIGKDALYGVPTYRSIEEIEFYKLEENTNQLLNDEDFFGFIENGTFSIKEQAGLSSAPLGIYGREIPYLASDSSKKLQQTAVPGSFITTPAHGLISIDWAEKVKGSAPIDAIRVKVAGITGYDKEAAALIRQLADEWEEKGFTVDIVAGASLQDLTVEVEGIGEIVQSFTSLGAADTVVASWNVLQVTLTILYGLVAITFVGFTFFNLLKDRQKDEQLLALLGWSEKLIRRVRYKEWATMLVIPIVLVIIGFTVLGVWKNQWLPLTLSMGLSVIVVVLFMLATILQNKQPKQRKGRGKTVTLQNIWFYRFNILASCIQLFLTTILSCFLPFFLLNHVKSTTKTRLGSYVHGEIEGIFIVVIVLLYFLSLVTVYQSLSRMWKKRQSEIQLFTHIGWEKKAIRNYFSKEVFIWAGMATLVGWIVSQIVTVRMIEVTAMTVISGVVVVMLILCITLGASIYSLHRVQVKGGN